MSDHEISQALTMEDRLKAIAYQFIALYERWSEDRQLAAKQGADTAELVKVFTEQVKGFKELEPSVRQHLVQSIQNATLSAAQKIGEEVGKGASRATEQVAKQLAEVTEKTERTLTRYRSEVITTQWKVIGATVVSSILASLLIVWLLIPKPTLPLTETQIKALESGQLLYLVWPKLTKKEQQHWLDLANQTQYSGQHSERDDSASH